MCACVCTCGIRRQLVGIGSLFPSCGAWALNSGGQVFEGKYFYLPNPQPRQDLYIYIYMCVDIYYINIYINIIAIPLPLANLKSL